MILEFTVSEITKILQNFIHETFCGIKIKGEISNLSQPKSGHTYFILKDEKSLIYAVCWKYTKLPFSLADGLEVKCTGYLTTYQSKYQIVVEKIELAGLGSIQLMLDERKARLTREGLFDQDRKKKLPFLPKVLGIITSTSGAVINDIINRVESRFPMHVIIWPVSVQGVEACDQIINAISGFNKIYINRPDVIIIARGGGSIEDLLVFNEELLVRAIVKSEIPVISAVGHESDFTLADYAADVRAPTPTAAVEIAVPTKEQVMRLLGNYWEKLSRILKYNVSDKYYKINNLYSRLRSPKSRLDILEIKLMKHIEKINLIIMSKMIAKEQYLSNLYFKLRQYDKNQILNLGYTLIYKEYHHMNSSFELNQGDEIIIEWKDGKRQAVVK